MTRTAYCGTLVGPYSHLYLTLPKMLTTRCPLKWYHNVPYNIHN